jgi:N6-L-threonylcarbamoyladenine synthase
MKNTNNYDFSFSGLKTAVLYDFLSRNKKTQKDKDYIYEMAKETEEAITDVLIFKFKKAIKEYRAKTALMGGGVTANKTLQKKVKELEKEFPKTEFIFPPSSLSTDNAEMIGAAASIEKTRKKYNEVGADSNLKIYGKI